MGEFGPRVLFAVARCHRRVSLRLTLRQALGDTSSFLLVAPKNFRMLAISIIIVSIDKLPGFRIMDA